MSREKLWKVEKIDFKNYFKYFSLSEACTLLTLPFGSASLLHDTIKPYNRSTSSESHKVMKETLKELGINYMPIPLAVDILERRTDICL